MGTPSVRRAILVALGLLPLTGCVKRIPQVGPEDIPRLEQEAAAAPEDLDVRVQLGIAYYRAGEYERARATLGRAVEAGAESGAAFLFLGLAHESLGDWSGAREAYSRYLELGRFDPLKEELRSRLALIVRRELEAEVREALRREAELAAQPPEPRTVAVFPLRFVGEREELRPLQVALADMMTTDFSLVGGVTVLERARVQTLLTEMALAEAGYTEPATGARAGRLLRAEHVVQGAVTTLGEEGLRLDASVVAPVEAAPVGTAEGEGALEQIFDLEKTIVFRVLDVLGVPVTPAEREAITENRAENLLAFLAYGRGLQALDRGDYAEAASFFQQAVELDPNFGRAQDQQQQAVRLQEAAAVETTQIAELGAREMEGGPVLAGGEAQVSSGVLSGGAEDLLQQTAEEIAPTPTGQILEAGGLPEGGTQQGENRDPVQEGQGQDVVTKATTGRITITIRRPGGREP